MLVDYNSIEPDKPINTTGNAVPAGNAAPMDEAAKIDIWLPLNALTESEGEYQYASNWELQQNSLLLSIIEAAMQDEDKFALEKFEEPSSCDDGLSDETFKEELVNYAINFLDFRFKEASSSLDMQINSEGLIDNIYNSIKENNGILSDKYTQEKLKSLVYATMYRYQALSLYMSGDVDNANLALSKELVENVNSKTTATDKFQCYVDFFDGNKQKALEAFNSIHGESLTQSITQYAMETSQPIPQGTVQLALDSDGGYYFEVKNENNEIERFDCFYTPPENFIIKNYFPTDDAFSVDISIENIKNANISKDIQSKEEMYRTVNHLKLFFVIFLMKYKLQDIFVFECF